MKIVKFALLAALYGGANAFVINPPALTRRAGAIATPIFSTEDDMEAPSDSTPQDDEPSDVNPIFSTEDDVEAPSDSTPQDDEPSDVNPEISVQDAGKEYEVETKPAENSLQKVLEIGARTGRGEFASKEEKESALALIEAMEAGKPSLDGVMWKEQIYGRWELVYCSTELFRSSPFFMAGRAVCTTDEQVKQYNWFCEMHRKALAISTIGAVRQIISPSRMISEFETKAGAVPFLHKFTPFAYSGGAPVTIEGAIVSSADIDITDEGDAFAISMDTVEIKGSNLPGIRQLLDSGLKLESRQLGSFLENNLAGYTNPKPIFETTYLDDRIRISRDQDNNVFVYSKVSDNMDATDYSGVMPDLGVARLLEGFNDSVTKFYL